MHHRLGFRTRHCSRGNRLGFRRSFGLHGFRVVDLKGFNEKFWFDNGGLPHTEQLHLIEKFTRTDMKTMKYEVTIDDPGAYTKPWTSSWTLEWIPGQETPYFLCQDNRP